MAFKRISDLGDLTGKTAVVRVDLNVPMADGKVTDDTRLQAVKPTVDAIAAAGGRSVLLAHFGRPKGQVVAEMSLKPWCRRLPACWAAALVLPNLATRCPVMRWWCLRTPASSPAKKRTTLSLRNSSRRWVTCM